MSDGPALPPSMRRASPLRRLLALALPVVAVIAIAVFVVATSGDDGPDPSDPPELAVSDAVATPAATGGTAAVYVTVASSGGADALVGASSEAAQVTSMHRTTEQGGQSTMAPVDRLEVPAGDELVLQPGGDHLMLESVTADVAAGSTVPVTLTFERSAPLDVEAEVVEYADIPDRFPSFEDAAG